MVIQGDSHAEASVPSPPPVRRRLGRAPIVACALVAVALVAWAVWAGVSSAAIGGVRVTYDAQPLVCEGTEVGTVPSVENPAFVQPVAVLTPGMRCELRIHVVNDARSAVTVTAVSLVGLGHGNPLAIEPVTVNPNGQHRLDDVDGAAVFEITDGVQVPAGTSATFTALLDYAGGAQFTQCSSQGTNMPIVTVSALGASRDIQPPAESVVWFHAGSLTGCA